MPNMKKFSALAIDISFAYKNFKVVLKRIGKKIYEKKKYLHVYNIFPILFKTILKFVHYIHI